MAAVVTDTVENAHRDDVSSRFWTVSIEGDLSACEPLIAAPGPGVSHYVDYVQASGGLSDVTIGAGEAGNDVEAVILGPIKPASVGGQNAELNLHRPVKLPADKSLTVDASAAAAVSVVVQGFTA